MSSYIIYISFVYHFML